MAEPMSLAGHLRQKHGWSVWKLSPDGHFARIRVTDSLRSAYEPYRRFVRWFSRQRLPMWKVLPFGARVRFSPFLKYETPGVHLFFALVCLLRWRRGGKEACLMPELTGSLVQVQAPAGRQVPSYDQFPAGQWLEVIDTEFFGLVSLKDKDGNVWTMLASVFTYVALIEIDPSSV
jgi:hypothetical protein